MPIYTMRTSEQNNQRRRDKMITVTLKNGAKIELTLAQFLASNVAATRT